MTFSTLGQAPTKTLVKGSLTANSYRQQFRTWITVGSENRSREAYAKGERKRETEEMVRTLPSETEVCQYST